MCVTQRRHFQHPWEEPGTGEGQLSQSCPADPSSLFSAEHPQLDSPQTCHENHGGDAHTSLCTASQVLLPRNCLQDLQAQTEDPVAITGLGLRGAMAWG